MKRYKLLKDLPTFNKGDIFRLTEHGHLMSGAHFGKVQHFEQRLV